MVRYIYALQITVFSEKDAKRIAEQPDIAYWLLLLSQEEPSVASTCLETLANLAVTGL